MKFFLYFIFLVFFYLDIELALTVRDEQGHRVKDLLFIICKLVCSTIQLIFFAYEVVQMYTERAEYLQDKWNYLEVMGFIIYARATIEDFYLDKPDDQLRILYVITALLALIKTIYLIRVFQQLNFLVTMITTVLQDIVFFLFMFSMYLLTFACCFHLADVDIASYGRMNPLLAHIFAVLRCAMGDFAMIDMYNGFDLVKDAHAEDES